jgi:hypothetical protein
VELLPWLPPFIWSSMPRSPLIRYISCNRMARLKQFYIERVIQLSDTTSLEVACLSQSVTPWKNFWLSIPSSIPAVSGSRQNFLDRLESAGEVEPLQRSTTAHAFWFRKIVYWGNLWLLC